jgi:hypothetical protein
MYQAGKCARDGCAAVTVTVVLNGYNNPRHLCPPTVSQQTLMTTSMTIHPYRFKFLIMTHRHAFPQHGARSSSHHCSFSSSSPSSSFFSFFF